MKARRQEKRSPMKKIVILSDNSASSIRWLTPFNALFPECEIEIRMVSAEEKEFQSNRSAAYRQESG
jgi:hypothetical protein